VAPDSNPYLLLFTIIKTGLEAERNSDEGRPPVRLLPATIEEAMSEFEDSELTTKIMGSSPKAKYISFKRDSADRGPRSLGTSIKQSEIVYHHEVYNQDIWNRF
jgi:glutamine synthetase